MGIPIRSHRRRFIANVVFPVVAIAVLSTATLVLVLFAAVRNADTLSAARQADSIRQAVKAQIAEIPHEQQSVVIWEDAVQKTRRGDMVWVHENLGAWMYNYFRHDRVYIFAADGQVVYAMEGGAEMPISSPGGDFARIRTFAAALHSPHAAAEHARLHAASEHASGDEDTMHKDALHRTALMSVAGRPAVVSAMSIGPHENRERVGGAGAFIHVSVQFLDGAFLTKIARRLFLESARFLPIDQVVPEGKGSVAVESGAGEAIGAFVWSPPTPGATIFETVLPIGVLILISTALMTGMLLRRLYRSIVELETSQEQARYLAFHDCATGLPNRRLLVERLDSAIAHAARSGQPGAFLLLDLDHLKEINKAYGLAGGDAIIQETANRLSEVVGEWGMLARLAGDEFAVILTSAGIGNSPRPIADRIMEAFSSPFLLDGQSVNVRASVGVVEIVSNAVRHEILRRGDAALKEAKRSGRGCYRVFNRGLDAQHPPRTRIEQELRAALETGNGLEVHYQPKISAASGRVSGVEALVRWRHEELGQIGPATFVPIAEECGLVAQLDEWVMSEAARAARQWPDVTLAVNVSAAAFRAPGLAGRVLKVLSAAGLAAGRLEIEITETSIVDVSASTLREIRALRTAGIRIALDDFGTGYSSLEHLTRLKVDRIKIDRSFVHGLGKTESAAAIVGAIVKLGHTLGLTITAEGVETKSQRDFLHSIGCDEMQGYLFARPVPAKRIPALLKSGSFVAAP